MPGRGGGMMASREELLPIAEEVTSPAPEKS
jgi:hypothetical protein